MAFDAAKAAAKRRKAAPKARGVEPVEAAEYRARAKAEAERRDLATDAFFYSCFCFKTEAERARFVGLLGLDLIEGRYIFGEEFRAALESAGVPVLAKQVRQVPPGVLVTGVEDPFEQIDPNLDDWQAIQAEWVIIHDMLAPKEPKPTYRHAVDSPYWFCVIAKCRADRDMLLRDYGWLRYGNTYVDGTLPLRQIEKAVGA